MKYNFHTHSHFDDGKETLEDFVRKALDLGFDALGFSGHSPIPFENEWSIKAKDLPEYVAQVKKLQKQYEREIPLYLGLEIDYIPGHLEDFDIYRKAIPLDYCIGSVHLVRQPESGEIWFIDGPAENFFNGVEQYFHGNARKAVTAFYEQSIEMVMTQRPDIIGHMDKVKMHNKGKLFDISEPWYTELTDRLLRAIKESETIVEVNTRGVYTGKSDAFFPDTTILEKCLHYEIPVMVNADAHHPDQLLHGVEEATNLLRDIGFTQLRTPFFLYAI